MPLTLFATCNIMHIFGTFILLNYVYVHFCPYFVHIYVETLTRACIYILTLLAVYIVHIVLYFVLYLGSMNSKQYNIMYHCLCVCIFYCIWVLRILNNIILYIIVSVYVLIDLFLIFARKNVPNMCVLCMSVFVALAVQFS